MRIYVSVKQAGRRKSEIVRREVLLSETPPTLRALLEAVVVLEVGAYNDRSIAEESTPLYLLVSNIEAQATTGKVGFGERRGGRDVPVAEAVATAITAFEDGLFRVFFGDDEVEQLEAPLTLCDGDTVTFIRFTMMVGW